MWRLANTSVYLSHKIPGGQRIAGHHWKYAKKQSTGEWNVRRWNGWTGKWYVRRSSSKKNCVIIVAGISSANMILQSLLAHEMTVPLKFCLLVPIDLSIIGCFIFLDRCNRVYLHTVRRLHPCTALVCVTAWKKRTAWHQKQDHICNGF